MDAPDTTAFEHATRHVAEAEERCAGQRALIERMAAAGQDTEQAESVLLQLEKTLDLLRRHQQRLRQSSQNRS